MYDASHLSRFHVRWFAVKHVDRFDAVFLHPDSAVKHPQQVTEKRCQRSTQMSVLHVQMTRHKKVTTPDNRKNIHRCSYVIFLITWEKKEKKHYLIKIRKCNNQ